MISLNIHCDLFRRLGLDKYISSTRQHFENEDKVIDVIRQAEKKHRDNYLFLIVDRKNEKDGDRDYWLTAKEALDYGIIDEILVNKK